MRRSLFAVLGSIVLTASMVVVWPVGVVTLGPRAGIWTSADTALAQVTLKTEDGECVVTEKVDAPKLYSCVDSGKHHWYAYWDGSQWIGPLLDAWDKFMGDSAIRWWGRETLEAVTFFLGGGAHAFYLAAMVLVILAYEAATASLLAPGGECDASVHHGSPTVKVKHAGSTATPALARVDLWIEADCSVQMELVWQAELIEGWCHILVATGAGRSTPRGISPQEIRVDLDGGTTAIDKVCPAVDCPGNLDWLHGGNEDVGQVGSYLSSAPAKMKGAISTDGTLHIKPFTFENRLIFRVKELRTQQQRPEEKASCP